MYCIIWDANTVDEPTKRHLVIHKRHVPASFLVMTLGHWIQCGLGYLGLKESTYGAFDADFAATSDR